MSGTSVGQAVGAIAGGIVGFVVGGPVGAYQGFALGYTLGGIIDPPASAAIDGPRLEDLKVTTSAYGDPIALVYGPQNRVSGVMIWSTDLIETEEEGEDGGKGGGGGGGGSTYSYRMSLAILLSGRQGRAISKIWGNGKLIFDLADATGPVPSVDPVNGQTITKALGTHAVFDELRFWPGTATQVPDPFIESIEGAGNVPAYQLDCYVRIKDIQLADFGNRPPNLEFELTADDAISVGAVCLDITNRCGLGPVSVAHLTELVRGYALGRASNGAGALAPLAMAYHFDVAEASGQIRCVKRGRSMQGTVPIEHLGGRDPSSGPIEPIKFSTASAVGLPKEISVTFSDPELDYQMNAQRAFRDRGDVEANEATQLPLVLSATEGRQIADRLLWSPWTARRGAMTSTNDRWIRRGPGQVLGIPVAGQVLPYRIIRAVRGDNGVIEWELQRDDSQVYSSDATGVAGNVRENPLQLPGETLLQLMDCPILQDADDNAGFYWAVTAVNQGWRGAAVHRSSDGGSSYAFMSSVEVRTRIGRVASALPSGPTAYWDDGNTITVVLDYAGHALESRDDAAVLGGANGVWLGDPDGQGGEVLQFGVATLVAPQTYELSHLLRGRLGTEANVGTHGANETFVLLTLGTLGRSDFGPGDWNASRLYKPVSRLESLDDTASQSFTNTGVGKRPYSPTHVAGTRDTSNNLTVSWVRRSRLRSAGLAGPVPLGEASEAYEVDILSGLTVVRTISTTSPTVSYTAAQQTADGLTPGNPVSLRVYQISDVAGRGFPAAATV